MWKICIVLGVLVLGPFAYYSFIRNILHNEINRNFVETVNNATRDDNIIAFPSMINDLTFESLRAGAEVLQLIESMYHRNGNRYHFNNNLVAVDSKKLFACWRSGALSGEDQAHLGNTAYY
jgi:hypothetical protein